MRRLWIAAFALLMMVPSCVYSTDIDFGIWPNAGLAGAPFEGTIHVFGDIPISFTEVHDLQCEGCTVESYSLVEEGIAVRLTREGPGLAQLFLEAATTNGDYSETLEVMFTEP